MNSIKIRILEVADYIIKTKATIIDTAKFFNISKSTVHKDIRDKLIKIDYNKYLKVNKILNDHIRVRHILGGQSTKRKYSQLKLINER